MTHGASIDKIYFELLRQREEDHDRLKRELDSPVKYIPPNEDQKTRYMVKAGAIFIAGMLTPGR